MKNHRFVNLIRSRPPLTGRWLRFGWTTGNQFATSVTITTFSSNGCLVGTEQLRRDTARTRWSELLAGGWKRQN